MQGPVGWHERWITILNAVASDPQEATPADNDAHPLGAFLELFLLKLQARAEGIGQSKKPLFV